MNACQQYKQCVKLLLCVVREYIIERKCMICIGYRSTMRGSCFMEYYDQIRIIYGVCWVFVLEETCRWSVQEMNAPVQARALTNIKQQTNINIDSTEQTIFGTLLPRKQLCMHAVRFILSIRLAFSSVQLSMCSKREKTQKIETEFKFFWKANIKNKQTNVYERSSIYTVNKWNGGILVDRRKMERNNEKRIIFSKERMCA